MPDHVGVGIIGTGTIAQHHLRSLTRGGPGKPVAVFDVLIDRAEATAREFGIPNVAKSVEEAIGYAVREGGW